MGDASSKALYRLSRLFLKTVIGATGLLLLSPVAVLLSSQHGSASLDAAKRPLTIADAIRMTKLSIPSYIAPKGVAQFSPDGKKFVVVVRKGNLERNTNDYSMLLWNTSELSRHTKPNAVLTMSSSSNRDAIKEVSWLPDNETVFFLGEHPQELQQLYSLNIRTHVLKKLTDHWSNVIAYAVDRDARVIAYVAEEPLQSIWNDRTEHQGLVVGSQELFDLVTGQRGGQYRGSAQLFLLSKGKRIGPISTSGQIPWRGGYPCMSPDGRYLVVRTHPEEVPDNWKEYSDSRLHQWTTGKLAKGQYSRLERYDLVDTKTGKSRILLNSPIGLTQNSAVAWGPDSHSVAISGLYLPLNGLKDKDLKLRQSRAFAAEVQIPGDNIVEITADDLKVVRWDTTNQLLTLRKEGRSPGAASAEVSFRKFGNEWHETAGYVPDAALPDIKLREDMNEPPRIVAVDPTSNHESLLLELNPQFRQLKFAKEQEIHWRGRDGSEATGGLYYPVDYIPGNRYPLVIQTHGFAPHEFWIDGPFTSAFAAQPLAAKNIAVLQANESYDEVPGPKEVEKEAARLEGAIDYLDTAGLIDRTRVGIIGYSRTTLFVKYLLTHSEYDIAAASVAEGVDGGYFQYLQELNSDPGFTQFYEQVNGGLPFGTGVASWIERSPGFGIDRVKTPLRIEVAAPRHLLFDWEWFAVLSRLGKPVEMIVTRDGDHIRQKPWDRIVSQEGNVDWFTFWLKNEEDYSPEKAGQYIRWRELRKLHEVNQTAPRTN